MILVDSAGVVPARVSLGTQDIVDKVQGCSGENTAKVDTEAECEDVMILRECWQ